MDAATYALLNKKLQNVTLAFSYKGSVASVSDLPDNAEIGDLYTVGGVQYVWDGTAWVNVKKATAGDVSYNSEETYQAGTVGAEVTALKEDLLLKVDKDGEDDITVKNSEYLDVKWINAFDGNYTNGFVVQGSGSIVSNYRYVSNAARYNLAIVPIKPNTKYTVCGRQESANISLFRVITATKLLADLEYFDGGVVFASPDTSKKYCITTITTGPNDKYLYVYGLDAQNQSGVHFLQVYEGEISIFTTDQYNVYYGVPNEKLYIPAGVKVSPVSATRFNLKVYDTASKKWMTHTFIKQYYADTLEYGSGQSKSVVGSDVWQAEYIKDESGNNIMQGNTNFIHDLAEEGHEGFVGAGHGCCVAIYTLFFADGKAIDPTALTEEIECSCFRMTEKVNHYLRDEANSPSANHSVPTLDANGDPIIESVEYLDAKWTINNRMEVRNRLDIVKNGIIFNECFSGMVTGYYPYFDNIMINDPEYVYNGLSGSGSNITVINKGGTDTVLSQNAIGTFDADTVILYGEKYRVSTRIIANDPARYSKLNIETARLPPNYDSRIKAYFLPCVCELSQSLIDKGETVETFATGDMIDVTIIKDLDVFA